MVALSFDRLRRGLRSPTLFFRELNRLYHRRLYTRDFNTTGVDVFAEDWDNLLLLDACRYDMFETQHDLPGTLESRRSRGSSTVEFLVGNMDGRELHDTVYVTANPQLARNRDRVDVSLHAVEHVWQTDGWDEEHGTVLPETVTRRALEALEQFPDKRLIVHYIQPHYPFLADDDPFDPEQAFRRPDEPGTWHQLMTGDFSAPTDDIWRAYRATLDRALPAVAEFLEGADGRSVVTADHGNMVGERARPFPIREWGHPRGIYTEELVEVPWHVVGGERRPHESEQPVERTDTVDDATVAERLENLGYR